MEYYVFLNDGETYSGVEGATIVGVDETSKAVQHAFDIEDWDRLFRLAKVVVPVTAPPDAPPRRGAPRVGA